MTQPLAYKGITNDPILQNLWHAIQKALYILTISVLTKVEQIWQMIKDAFSCQHPQALIREGKCYCPDCGEGIIHRWQFVRCSGCQIRREVTYRFRQWHPTHIYCPACGERHVIKETLENPRYHQLHLAYLVAIPAKEFESMFTEQATPHNIFFTSGIHLLSKAS